MGGEKGTIAVRPERWQIVSLNLDPSTDPDILMDAKELTGLQPGQFDAVYASHILEHVYEHQVEKILEGIVHVLKHDGAAYIRVPDIPAVCGVIAKGFDLDVPMLHVDDGDIRALDVIYGRQKTISESGRDFYAHKTGFSGPSLVRAIIGAGFREVEVESEDYELRAVAFKGERPAWMTE